MYVDIFLSANEEDTSHDALDTAHDFIDLILDGRSK